MLLLLLSSASLAVYCLLFLTIISSPPLAPSYTITSPACLVVVCSADMFAEGHACAYWEPESIVMSRSGDECVVAGG